MSAISAARLGWAALLLLRPRTVLRVAGDSEPDRRWLVVARVLGVRHLAQAWLERRGRRQTEIVGVVDGVHAASALGFGLFSKHRRRLAFVDGGVATAFALSGLWYERHTAGRCAPPPVSGV